MFVLGLSNWTYVLNESESSQIETTENHGGWTYETFAQAMKEFFLLSWIINQYYWTPYLFKLEVNVFGDNLLEKLSRLNWTFPLVDWNYPFEIWAETWLAKEVRIFVSDLISQISLPSHINVSFH